MAGLRLEILRVIISLPKDFSHFPNLSSYVSFHLCQSKGTDLWNSYITARTWNQLVKAVCKSTLGFPAENLVQLYHESEVPVPGAPASGVTRVIYKEIHDILRLLTYPPRPEQPLVCLFTFSQD